MSVAWVATWVAHFSYPAVFLFLVACGLGFPFSEDTIVLIGGTVVAETHGSLALMMISAYLGKLTGDGLIFRFGRKLGPHALTRPRFKKLFTPDRVKWIEGHFQKYGILTVFLARFLPGLRAPTYLAAGASGFPPRKFFLADAIAAGVSAPLLTWLGYRYGLIVFETLRHALHAVVAGVVGLLVLLLCVRYFRARSRERKEAAQVTEKELEDLPRHVGQKL